MMRRYRTMLRPAVVAGVLISSVVGSPVTASETTDACECSSPELSVASVGPFMGVDLATGQLGNSGMGQLGARALGLRSFGGEAWLARWDTRAAARAGYVAQGGPAPLVQGGQGRIEGELGRRLTRGAGWSPYLGAQGLLRGQWLSPHGGQSATQNELDFAEGSRGAGDLRLGLGTSYLDGRRSLLLSAFVQVSRRPTGSSAGEAFVDGGVEARLDLGSRLSAQLEASLGTTGPRHDWALGSTDRTTHKELDAALLLGLWRATWLGLEGGAAVNTDRLSYAGGQTFQTADPRSLRLGLVLGAWLWR